MTMLMNIFILSPNYNRLASKQIQAKLRDVGNVMVFSKPDSIQSLSPLWKGVEPCVIALDPDFCYWKAPNELFTIPHVKAICLQTTSFSWIDTKRAAMKSIPVINLRHWSTEAVAEWAMMLVFNLARRVPIIAQNNWKEECVTQQGIELVGKTIGIIGLGHIGTRIAEIAKGIGMNVQYWSRKSRDQRFVYVSLPKLIKTSDVIVPAMSQNIHTQGILSDKVLSMIQPSAMFIGIVHNIYNHDLLVNMVKHHKIFGYAFEENGGGMFNKYKGNILAGPANAWVTKEAEERNIEQWAQTIIDAAHGKFPQQVN
ncbi:MAG: D-isomer specific 2-hydroxyacid dehydrogenase NAD-binding protein [Microgenomates group bacterium GW2011_GWC1_39_12]|nr:MAG: D-isomer specific 2-hydroxyacid dehydrogenase NAD-binding protein [Microgenomates group bacterium GW2011_GWC1_39_12]